jgi:hypothetical protein
MYRRVDLVWTEVSEERIASIFNKTNSVILVRKRTVSTEQRIPTPVNFGFLDRSRYFLETASQLS